MNEEILQETPSFLDVTQKLYDIIDATQILFPLFKSLLEEGNELGKQHGVNRKLMALKNLEMFIQHFQCGNIRILQGDEFELDILPEFDDAVNLFLHFGFVFCNFA